MGIKDLMALSMPVFSPVPPIHYDSLNNSTLPCFWLSPCNQAWMSTLRCQDLGAACCRPGSMLTSSSKAMGCTMASFWHPLAYTRYWTCDCCHLGFKPQFEPRAGALISVHAEGNSWCGEMNGRALSLHLAGSSAHCQRW